MKKHCSGILIIALSLLLACPMTACKKKSETKATHIKGGSTKRVDKDAPKEIESTELISLSIKSSTIASVGVEEYEGLEYGVYYFEFEVDLKTKEGSGSYRFEKQYEEDEAVDYEFSADEDFMIKLEKIIRDGGISRLNGSHKKNKRHRGYIRIQSISGLCFRREDLLQRQQFKLDPARNHKRAQ